MDTLDIVCDHLIVAKALGVACSDTLECAGTGTECLATSNLCECADGFYTDDFGECQPGMELQFYFEHQRQTYTLIKGLNTNQIPYIIQNNITFYMICANCAERCLPSLSRSAV